MIMKRPILYLVASLLIVGAALAAVVAQFKGELSESDQLSEELVAAQDNPEAASCANHLGVPWNFSEGSMRVGEHMLAVAIADEHQEKQKGLGGCQEIPANSGMLFTFEPAGIPAFWMKDTLIPLDIVWVADNAVLEVIKNIQPEPDVADENLARYRPQSSVSAALELPAGTVAALGIEPGQSAVLEVIR